MFPKGPTRRQEKSRIRRLEHKWTAEVRNLVATRDKGCRLCGLWEPVNMHEIVFRSKTRGMEIQRRISTQNCVILCVEHHRAIHDNKLEIVMVDPKLGADGELEFKKNDVSFCIK